MKFENGEIPDELVNASFNGKLVIFAGAGVSMRSPVNLPSFGSLIDVIKTEIDPAKRLRKRKQTTNEAGKVIYEESPEQYLSYLDHEKHNVKASCASIISSKGGTTELHANLSRLFQSNHPIKIVTTNFDCCFETALDNAGIEYQLFCAPALPLGDDFEGLVHLHGVAASLNTMILTAEDYGKAYVSNGWASRFLVDLFKSNTVLFIGYSCGDSLVDYLTRSISQEMQGKTFVLCRETEVVDEWTMRGVTPIPYAQHEDLPILINDWANHLEQSITDRVRKLKKLGATKHLSKMDRNYVRQALQWANEDERALFVKGFCKTSNFIEHLRFMDEEGLTDFLTKDKLTDAELSLLRWTTANFCIDFQEELQDICLTKKTKLSISFYSNLALHLSTTDAPPSAISVWIPWFESMPRHYRASCVYSFVAIANACEHLDVFLAISKILLKVDFTFSASSLTETKRQASIPLNNNYPEEEYLTGLLRHHKALGRQLFDYCFEQIESAYSIQTDCWTKPEAPDSISFSRSSIKKSEQNLSNDNATNILLDIAREAIDESFAENAIKKCLESRCALLVRLGLWAMKEFTCSGEALKLVTERAYLRNDYLRCEVFQLIRASFAVASSKQKSEFIEHFKTLYSQDERGDWKCYNLCSWILDMVNDDSLQRMKDDISERNPHFQPSEHPELFFYSTARFVDDSDEYEIPSANFTIETLLKNLSSCDEGRSSLTSHTIVSTPTRHYPEKALDILEELLKEKRSIEENNLTNLMIVSFAWNHPLIQQEDAVRILSLALNNPSTCIAAINSLATFTLSNNNQIEWTAKELASLLESVRPNKTYLLEEESAFRVDENPDWFLIGINHPVGKYLRLLATLEQKEHSEVAITLLKELDILDMPETSVSKALIALLFADFNIWIEADSQYAKEAAILLKEDSWAQNPSWQGMSWLASLSIKTWEATSNSWKVLFERNIDIEEACFNRLVRLYIWSAIMRAHKTERIEMLKICASASSQSLQAACSQINNWLKTIEAEERVATWNDWLSDSFRFLAADCNANKKIIAETYCLWARKYPELRRSVANGILRDCSDLNERSLFFGNGDLESIATDRDLSEPEKATIITFLLNHKRHFIHKEDARKAASHLCCDTLTQEAKAALQDAFTRCGMEDVLSKDEPSQ